MNHRNLILAFVVAASSAAAHAELSFNAGAVSDYRYRGISQSRLQPALQGGADYSIGSLYIGTWGSTINWIKDARRAGGLDGNHAELEIDLYAGYKADASALLTGLSYDLGVLGYVYPRNKLNQATGFSKADTAEAYGAVTYKFLTAKYSHALTDTFGTPDSDHSYYADLSANFDIGHGVTLTPHIGYQHIAGPSKDVASYADYSLTASKDVSGFILSATVVGTDASKAFYATPTGKATGKTGVVLGAKRSF